MRLLLWILAKVPIGPLAPYVLGLVLGCWPHEIKEENGE